MFAVRKTFGPFSCAFRQPDAESHCSRIHGYGLKFIVEFRSSWLDENGWVIDFGGLKIFKAQLEEMYDHKTVLRQDDPAGSLESQLSWYADIRLVPAIGMESFALEVSNLATAILTPLQKARGVYVSMVEAREHENNCARWYA